MIYVGDKAAAAPEEVGRGTVQKSILCKELWLGGATRLVAIGHGNRGQGHPWRGQGTTEMTFRREIATTPRPVYQGRRAAVGHHNHPSH